MTDPNNETVWITIPDEATTPMLDALTKAHKDESGKVKNKAFWGGAFVALAVFATVLFVPQQFVSLMKGDLFDGTFQVVPDYEEQDSGTLFEGGEGEGEEGEGEEVTTQDEAVVEAESEAVTIQIEPVTESEEVTGEGEDATEAEAVETATGDESVTEAETITLDEETGEAELGAAEAAGSDTDLLQSLSQQLNELKEKDQQNEQLIQDLMRLLEDQASGLHGTASTQPTTYLPEGQATATQAQIGIGASAGTYRYNTHTVTVSPYDVLAQNKAAEQASYQANVTYSGVQPYSAPTYSPQLAATPAQPGTGPAETILFALALASLGVLVWGTVRAIRA